VDTGRRTGFSFTGVSRYDLLLWLLPLPLALGGVWGAVSGLPLSFGVGAGGVPSLAMLGYGLFVDDPTAALPTPENGGSR
jgi:hypothetical protein